MKDLERITFDPQVMGGKPCIRGMRVTVGTIVGLLAAGRAIEEVLGIEGIGAKAVPNIMQSMWQKFAGICGIGLFSVVRGDAGANLGDSLYEATLYIGGKIHSLGGGCP